MEAQEPSWLLGLVGWLLGSCLALLAGKGPSLRSAGSTDVAASASQPASARAEQGSSGLADWTVRELRQLPGIGPSRAVAIARERWRSRFPRTAVARDPTAVAATPSALSHVGKPGTLLLTDVPGIGPATSAGVAAWLRDRGWKTSCTSPDPPARPEARIRAGPEGAVPDSAVEVLCGHGRAR